MTGRNSFAPALALCVILLVGACASLPENFEQPVSYVLTDTDDTRLGEASREKREGHPGQSGFHLLSDGLDAFVARAVLADAAERSIDAQYYILHKDLTGRLFVDRLLRAADRGVRVRLLVDDMDVGDKELSLLAADSHPNMEVRLFNPFARNVGRAGQFVTRGSEVGRRMHSKSFTVDNQYAILGGRNIGNEYFDADPSLEFADLDVMAIGPVVEQVSAAFDEYWNSELAYPAAVLAAVLPTNTEVEGLRARLADYVEAQEDSDYLRALRDSDLSASLRSDTVGYYWGDGRVAYDSPDKLLEELGSYERDLRSQLRPVFQTVREELIIFSPYFVPGKQGVAALSALSEQGVRVRILTNSLASNDVLIVHAGYLKFRRALLRAGVEIYELNSELLNQQRRSTGGGGSTRASLHAKSFVFDRESVFIGSLNLDPRAVEFNTEIGFVVSSPEMAGDMSRRFDERIEQVAFRVELVRDDSGTETLLWRGLVDGEPVEFDYEPHTSVWQRFAVSFLSIFPIESQL